MAKSKTNQTPMLCQSFIRQAREALLDYPQIRHEWTMDADAKHCILHIPQANNGGFPVTVEVHPDEIMVTAGGAHTNFHLDETPDELVAHTLGLVLDLMSPVMRIREHQAGGKPYKWAFELYENGQWITEEYCSLFFWNYFGKRTEITYQNKILPPRESCGIGLQPKTR